MNYDLSDKEKKLLEVIKTTTEDVTCEFIKQQLGEPYLGAIGKLLRYELIKVEKKRIETKYNQFGMKMIKCYVINEKRGE